MKESDHYQTDQWLMKIFDGWFDPCPFRCTDEEGWRNGLLEIWTSPAFVNPPYSDPMPWVEKAIIEARQGKTVVMLLKHDSSTRWYMMLQEHGARFLPIHGRLKFRTGASASFPSVLVVL